MQSQVSRIPKLYHLGNVCDRVIQQDCNDFLQQCPLIGLQR